MARGPGQIDVVTEVGYCPSCGRTRNLRREQHHLGQLVRTTVTCETCHRTLSSSIGPAQAATPEPEPEPEPKPEPVAAQKTATPQKPAVKKPAAKKPAVKKAAAKKPAVKKPAAKPTSTSTRKVTKKKR